MKRLLLLRHAKSSWDDTGLDDHDRPLAARGQRAAAAMGVYLQQRAIAPDLVLCSSARRARETFARLDAAVSGDVAARVERDLYLAEPGELLEQLRAVDDRFASVLLIGHNPGLAQLASLLAGSGDPRELGRLRSRYPTATLAHLRFEGDRWRDLAPASCHLEAFARPRDLV